MKVCPLCRRPLWTADYTVTDGRCLAYFPPLSVQGERDALRDCRARALAVAALVAPVVNATAAAFQLRCSVLRHYGVNGADINDALRELYAIDTAEGDDGLRRLSADPTEEAEAIVSKLMADNAPKATTERRLGRR